ncbi:hypothetical protein U1Q18_003101, partial [Sarracenia purpurea var. burkii]
WIGASVLISVAWGAQMRGRGLQQCVIAGVWAVNENVLVVKDLSGFTWFCFVLVVGLVCPYFFVVSSCGFVVISFGLTSRQLYRAWARSMLPWGCKF